MDGAEMLDLVRTARTDWDAAIDAADLDSEAGDGWLLRDHVAHITWFEREMVGLFGTHRLDGDKLWLLPLNERNEAIRKLGLDVSSHDVRADAISAFGELVAAVEKLADGDRDDSGRFDAMPPEWVPWQILAHSTYQHYADYTDILRR